MCALLYLSLQFTIHLYIFTSGIDIISGLQLGRAKVLKGLMNFLNMDRPEHHSTDRLKERGVEKGSGRHSTLQGQKQSVFNQTSSSSSSAIDSRAGQIFSPVDATKPAIQ